MANRRELGRGVGRVALVPFAVFSLSACDQDSQAPVQPSPSVGARIEQTIITDEALIAKHYEDAKTALSFFRQEFLMEINFSQVSKTRLDKDRQRARQYGGNYNIATNVNSAIRGGLSFNLQSEYRENDSHIATSAKTNIFDSKIAIERLQGIVLNQRREGVVPSNKFEALIETLFDNLGKRQKTRAFKVAHPTQDGQGIYLVSALEADYPLADSRILRINIDGLGNIKVSINVS